MSEPMKIRDFQDAAQDWRVVSDGACAFYVTSSLGQAAAFVEALAQVPNMSEHRYGIDIRPSGVTVRLVPLRDDYIGMDDTGPELTTAVSADAAQEGLKSDPSRIQSLLIV